MANKFNYLPIPKFNGEVEDYWSIKIQTLLVGKDLWDVLQDGYIEPTNWRIVATIDKQGLKDTKKNSLDLYHI